MKNDRSVYSLFLLCVYLNLSLVVGYMVYMSRPVSRSSPSTDGPGPNADRHTGSPSADGLDRLTGLAHKRMKLIEFCALLKISIMTSFHFFYFIVIIFNDIIYFRAFVKCVKDLVINSGYA